MSELLERLTAAESVCRDWGFRDTQRTIFDAKARIAELEASLADSNEALQILGLKLAHAEAEIPAMKAQLDCIMKWAADVGDDEGLVQIHWQAGYEAARSWVLEVGLCAMTTGESASTSDERMKQGE